MKWWHQFGFVERPTEPVRHPAQFAALVEAFRHTETATLQHPALVDGETTVYPSQPKHDQ